MRVRVGTTSWTYPDWVGPFYPPQCPSEERLRRYARVFGLVEADATFYRIPKLEVTERWASETPEGFVFTTKFSRRITHDAGLVGVEEPTRVFVERMEPLRKAGKMGALLAQFAPSFTATKNQALLGPFLDLVPRGWRVAVEFRHKSWFTEATYKALRDRNAALVWAVAGEQDTPDVVTADFLYARLIGPDRVFERFGELQRDLMPRMRAFKERLDAHAAELQGDVLVLCSNHFEGHGPATAARAAALLGLPPPDMEAAKRPVGAQRGLGDF